MAAVEALTRGLSAELASQGIRVVGLRPQGMPETGRIKESFEGYAKASEMTWEQFQESLAGRTQRAPAFDARGAGQRDGLHRFRQGERDDGNDRQFEPGQPGRLAAKRPRLCPRHEQPTALDREAVRTSGGR
jgi:NAD(P)-dependent dehydrogenase (short-subunit alcohol dehydrogenase family)